MHDKDRLESYGTPPLPSLCTTGASSSSWVAFTFCLKNKRDGRDGRKDPGVTSRARYAIGENSSTV